MKRLIIKYKFIFLIALFAVAVVFLGQYFLNKDNSSTSDTQTTSDTVKRGDITESISASGQVQTANYLAITTSVNGIVKSLFVKEGDKVVQGQKIMEVTLDSEGERSRLNSYSSYLKANNSLDSAKNNLYSLEVTKLQKEEVFSDLKQNNSYQSHDERLAFKIAENDAKKAKNDYDAQQGTISQLQISLSNAWIDYQSQSPIITSPADGIVANIISVEGTKVENSVTDRSIKTVASIKKEGTPIVTVNVNELDINKVKVGQKVNVLLNSLPDSEFTGNVVGIDKIGSVQSGVSNYPVIIKLNSDNEQILPNMGAEASIIIESKSGALLVPSSAITTSRNGKIVKVIKDTQTLNVTITTGISDDTNTEVISGLNEGDTIEINSLPTQGFTSQTQTTNRGFGGIGGFGTQQRRQ